MSSEGQPARDLSFEELEARGEVMAIAVSVFCVVAIITLLGYCFGDFVVAKVKKYCCRRTSPYSAEGTQTTQSQGVQVQMVETIGRIHTYEMATLPLPSYEESVANPSDLVLEPLDREDVVVDLEPADSSVMPPQRMPPSLEQLFYPD